MHFPKAAEVDSSVCKEAVSGYFCHLHNKILIFPAEIEFFYTFLLCVKAFSWCKEGRTARDSACRPAGYSQCGCQTLRTVGHFLKYFASLNPRGHHHREEFVCEQHSPDVFIPNSLPRQNL